MPELPIRLFVLWQSLVVRSYRSAFEKLKVQDLALVAPEEFMELGSQRVRCEPADQKTSYKFLVLPAQVWHVQAVWFRGLVGSLRSFFSVTALRDAQSKQIFLCMAEPYSITALLAYFALVLSRCKKPHFVGYGAQNIDKPQGLLLRTIEKLMLKKMAAIWVIGKEQAELLQKRGYQGKLWRLPLWYNAEIFRYQTPKSSSKVAIGFAGAFSEYKGFPDFIEAYLGLRPEIRSSLEVAVAGRGPYEELLKKAPEIQNLGPLQQEDLAKFFCKLDYLVICSRTLSNIKEQFGRVIVEAQACGVIVIGSSSGMIPEIIDDPKRIFPERNPEALGAKLLELIEAGLHRDLQYRQTLAADMQAKYADVSVARALEKAMQEL